MISDTGTRRLQGCDFRQHRWVSRSHGEMQAGAEPASEQEAPSAKEPVVVLMRVCLADIGELIPLARTRRLYR